MTEIAVAAENRRWMALAIAVLLFSTGTSFAEETRVGNWGDPDKIVVEGTTTIAASAIQKALAHNLEVISAAREDRPLDHYTAVLSDRTLAGLKRQGFPRGIVAVSYDEATKRVVVNVKEGPRFRCGPVQVSGAVAVTPTQLTQWLTRKQPPASAVLAGYEAVGGMSEAVWVNSSGERADLELAAWQLGEPARFDEQSLPPLQKAVQRALAEAGFRFAKFTMSVEVPDDATGDTHNAVLNIRLEDEGPVALIGNIEVTGNERDTADDIVRYLGLKTGRLMSESERTAAWHKLWITGRFLQHTVEIVRPANHRPGQPIDLHVTVQEYAKAPPLRQRLSPAEQTLLRCREWILGMEERGDDLVTELSRGSDRLTVIYSGKHGLLINAVLSRKGFFADLPDAWPWNDGREFLLSFTDSGILMRRAGVNEFLQSSFDLKTKQVKLNLGMQVRPKDDKEHRYSFNTGVGIATSNTPKEKPPVQFSLSVHPAYALAQLHEYGAKFTEENGQLSILSRNDRDRLIVESATGRMVEYLSEPEDDKNDGRRVRVYFERDALAKRLPVINERLTAEVDKPRNVYDGKRPLGSSLGYMLNDGFGAYIATWVLGDIASEGSSSETKEAVARATQIRRGAALISGGVADALDRWLIAYRNAPESKFRIPLVTVAGAPLEKHWAFGFIAYEGVEIADAAFPCDAWPWKLCRAAAMFSAGKGDEAVASSLALAANQQTGPLTCWVMAKMTEPLSAEATVLFAAEGLKRLTPEKFIADVKPLLANDKLCGATLLRAAELLAELDEESARALGDSLLGERRELFVDAARRLRQNPDAAPIDRLQGVLLLAWNEGGKDLLAEQLRKLEEHNRRLAERRRTEHAK